MNNVPQNKRKYLVPGIAAVVGIIVVICLMVFTRGGNIYKAIPNNAAVVLETQNFEGVFTQLQKSKGGAAIAQTGLAGKLQLELAAIARTIPSTSPISKSFSSRTNLASLHLTQADDYEFLFAVYADGISEKDITNLAAKNPAAISKHVYKGQNIYELQLDSNRVLALAKVKGVMLLSFASYLTESGTEALLSGNNILDDKNFRSVQNNTEHNDGLLLYINYSKISSLFPVVVKSNKLSLLSGLPTFATWTAGSITCTDEKIELDGITALTEDEDANWQNENVLEYSLLEKIPDNACYINLSAQPNGEGMQKVADKNNAPQATFFKEWAGAQSAFITLEALKEDYTDQNAFIVKVDDKTKAILKLRGYMREGGVAIEPADTFMGAEILRLQKEDVINKVFGGTFNKISNPYFALHSDVLIFTNNIDALKLIIEKLSRKETINKVLPAYPGPVERFVYINPSRASLLMNGFFNNEGGASANRFTNSFNHIAVLVHKEGKLAKTKIILETGKSTVVPAGIIWKTKLKTVSSSAPKLVYDNNSSDYMIFAQDTLGNALMLDKSGEQVWAQKFDEQVIGDIYQLDYYSNGVYYYLFNTANKVYVVDSKGEAIDGFPLRLSSPATAGLVLLNYDNRNIYRFFVPCANGSIFGYEGNGRPLAGWNPRTGTGTITSPITYFAYNNTDYIVTTGAEGRLLAMDRKGQARFAMDNLPIYNQPFSMVKVKGGFKLLNAAGAQLTIIDKDGNDNIKTLIDSAASFTAANLTDSTYVYVFATDNVVRVYDDKDNFKYSGQLNSAQISNVKVLNLGGTNYIQATDATAKKIYLYDMQLRPAFIEPIKYGGGALVCHLGGKTGTISIITTPDGYVEARRIK
jgi:hypothetical protein